MSSSKIASADMSSMGDGSSQADDVKGIGAVPVQCPQGLARSDYSQGKSSPRWPIASGNGGLRRSTRSLLSTAKGKPLLRGN